MQGKAKVLGHAIHPMLIPFPIGLLGLAPVFDVVYLVTSNGFWAHCAYWLVACGLISALVAAIPGTIDWLAIPRRTRARRVGLFHMGANLSAVVLYGASFAVRHTSDPPHDGAAAFALALAGMAVMMVGGWLGGELVERLTMSVDVRADLNAPSSLADAHRGGDVGHLPQAGRSADPSRTPYPLEPLDPRSV